MWRIIIIACLAGIILYLIRGYGAKGNSKSSTEELVQDALTGVYFSKSEAVSISRQGKTLYFSSIENRDRFLAERR